MTAQELEIPMRLVRSWWWVPASLMVGVAGVAMILAYNDGYIPLGSFFGILWMLAGLLVGCCGFIGIETWRKTKPDTWGK